MTKCPKIKSTKGNVTVVTSRKLRHEGYVTTVTSRRYVTVLRHEGYVTLRHESYVTAVTSRRYVTNATSRELRHVMSRKLRHGDVTLRHGNNLLDQNVTESKTHGTCMQYCILYVRTVYIYVDMYIYTYSSCTHKDHRNCCLKRLKWKIANDN